MNFKSLAPIAAAVISLGATASASAATFLFSAVLSGSAEAPPNSSTATGLALVSFNDVALSVTVNEIFIGLTGGGATASHIHCCTATAGTSTAPVVLGFTSFPNAVTGSYNNTFTLLASDFATLLVGTQAGKAYVNIHNSLYPGGEIRGFLTAAPVPEAGKSAMFLAGLGAMAWLALRRKVN